MKASAADAAVAKDLTLLPSSAHD